MRNSLYKQQITQISNLEFSDHKPNMPRFNERAANLWGLRVQL